MTEKLIIEEMISSNNSLMEALTAYSPVRLSPSSTPLHALPRVGRKLGIKNLLIKRDDLQPLGGGGNKLRKLEFLVGDALALGADTLVTAGALQSNHARLTAAVAAHLGLGCELLLVDRVPRTLDVYRTGGNRALNQVFGARSTVFTAQVDLQDELQKHCAQLREEGRKPYLIPFGGSNWRGTLGYVNMVRELVDQVPSDTENLSLVCACGSGGMIAGILTGIAALQLKWKVIGVSILGYEDATVSAVNALVKETLVMLDLEDTPVPQWEFYDKWIGPEYGVPGEHTRDVLAQVGAMEGIVMDPVYTGKAMEGLFGLAQQDPERFAHDTVIFVHSGGQAGLFAYPDLFQETWFES